MTKNLGGFGPFRPSSVDSPITCDFFYQGNEFFFKLRHTSSWMLTSFQTFFVFTFAIINYKK